MSTLTLKLPPEVAKIMPWIVSAKASGDLKQVAWAKREYEIATQRARERERWEHEAEERRRWREEDARAQQELLVAFREIDRQAAQEARWEHRLYLQGIDADGFYMPSQSSSKGWRRLLSECPDVCQRGRYGKWGGGGHLYSGHYSVKHNCGRKPRKPWFKKQRARH